MPGPYTNVTGWELEFADDSEAVMRRGDLHLGLCRPLACDDRVRARREQAGQHRDDASRLEHAVGDEQDLVGRVLVAARLVDRAIAPVVEREPRACDRDVQPVCTDVVARRGDDGRTAVATG